MKMVLFIFTAANHTELYLLWLPVQGGPPSAERNTFQWNLGNILSKQLWGTAWVMNIGESQIMLNYIKRVLNYYNT